MYASRRMNIKTVIERSEKNIPLQLKEHDSELQLERFCKAIHHPLER